MIFYANTLVCASELIKDIPYLQERISVFDSKIIVKIKRFEVIKLKNDFRKYDLRDLY